VKVLIRLQIKISPYFHWTNYTLNKTFPQVGKKPKIEGKLESEIGGT